MPGASKKIVDKSSGSENKVNSIYRRKGKKKKKGAEMGNQREDVGGKKVEREKDGWVGHPSMDKRARKGALKLNRYWGSRRDSRKQKELPMLRRNYAKGKSSTFGKKSKSKIEGS